jgi:hypothetical protein
VSGSDTDGFSLTAKFCVQIDGTVDQQGCTVTIPVTQSGHSYSSTSM